MSVTVIMGPMFSGKTTELFRRLKREIIAGNKTILFKYSNDIRYVKGNLASSHDGSTLEATPVSSLLGQHINNDVKVIGIDEGQFIEGLVGFCDYHANKGRTVIVSGLDANFKRDSFARIINLIPKAEHVIKLHSVCVQCKDKQGTFSKRLGSSEVLEDIGGADKYISVCRRCYIEPVQEECLEQYRTLLKTSI